MRSIWIYILVLVVLVIGIRGIPITTQPTRAHSLQDLLQQAKKVITANTPESYGKSSPATIKALKEREVNLSASTPGTQIGNAVDQVFNLISETQGVINAYSQVLFNITLPLDAIINAKG